MARCTVRENRAADFFFYFQIVLNLCIYNLIFM